MATATAIGRMHAAAGVTIMAGAGAAGTITAGAIIVTTDTRSRRGLLSSNHCPNESRRRDMDGRADRRGQSFPAVVAGRQPRPISTAIRIRSEWFLAPSFCFSSEVVLATVL